MNFQYLSWQLSINSNTLFIFCITAAMATTVITFTLRLLRQNSILLLDFSYLKADESCRFSHEAFVERSILLGTFTDENVAFQKRILERSGIGQSTYFPEAAARVPLELLIAEARKEGEMMMLGAVDLVLEKTGIRAGEIGVVVVNCSLFAPTPSLSAMIVNRYKMRADVASYNLSGMGCSAGVISVDLARQLLRVRPNTYALVVSTENLTLNGYYGNNRSMLVTNCIFRMGAAAVLLSNRRPDHSRANYILTHLVRTHKGADEPSYHCVSQEDDDTGKIGVALSKHLMWVAASSLKSNITNLAPQVLPFSEQLRFAASLLRRIPYVPDFKSCFEHFCVHAGGRAVLDELEKRLALGSYDMEPSRMTLYRFGNTSSSSLWYELGYAEAKGRIKKGDRVWQVAFGSGFKCNSAVWKALRDVKAMECDPWVQEIDRFPVDVPYVETAITCSIEKSESLVE